MKNRVVSKNIHRVLATVDLRPYSEEDIEVGFQKFDSSSVWSAFSSLKNTIFRLKDYDSIVFTSSTMLTLISIFFIKAIRPTKKIFIFDIILKFPKKNHEKVTALFKSLLLKSASGYLMIHKDWSGYRKNYNLNPEKCRYLPFKANNYGVCEKYKVRNMGYVLCCGASQRDIDTLIKAAKMINIPIKILLPKELAEKHNTRFTQREIPLNVTIVQDYLDKDDWYKIMADCLSVVVPIVAESLQPAGISVYLEAMLFRKPVVITDGSSTKGLLEHERHVLLVPPDDPTYLAHSLERLRSDQNLYRNLALNGFEYANSLKGHDRMMRDLLAAVANWR